MKKLNILLILVFIFNISNILKILGQDISSTATIDSSSLLIGDQRVVKIQVNNPGNLKLVWPTIPDTIGKIEILKKGKLDTIKATNGNIISQQLTITCFDTGVFKVTPFNIGYKKKQDTTLLISKTEEIILKVAGIPIDTSKEIKDIKPPLQVSFTFMDFLKEYAWYIVGGAALIAMIVAYFYFRPKKKNIIPEKIIPTIPPDMLAKEALSKLEKEKLWQKGEFKQYHSLLADILRIYIENRFGVKAIELTTDETLQLLRTIENDSKIKLRQILELADLVKFAKALPIASENELSLKNGFDFINSTAYNNETVRKEQGAQ